MDIVGLFGSVVTAGRAANRTPRSRSSHSGQPSPVTPAPRWHRCSATSNNRSSRARISRVISSEMERRHGLDTSDSSAIGWPSFPISASKDVRYWARAQLRSWRHPNLMAFHEVRTGRSEASILLDSVARRSMRPSTN